MSLPTLACFEFAASGEIPVNELLKRFPSLPTYGWGGVIVLVAYLVVAEIRFGAKARSSATGPADRGSTRAVSFAALVPVLGFVWTMQLRNLPFVATLPAWVRAVGTLPWMPVSAWIGVAIGGLGVLLRLWALLVLRERFTRTLLVHGGHTIERGGPYGVVRHPGYLGSLLCLNGLALASGNTFAFVASLAATIPAYAYRIRVEDQMLIEAFGEPYEAYRREVGALIPGVR
jgi:protein-S-isoprenylcysteine O-methyltransferase